MQRGQRPQSIGELFQGHGAEALSECPHTEFYAPNATEESDWDSILWEVPHAVALCDVRPCSAQVLLWDDWRRPGSIALRANIYTKDE